MLRHEVMGTGEPLVLVHGLTHRRQAWYPVVEHLLAHRQVILIDLPGHGESPDLVTDARPVQDVIRDELVALMDHLGLDRPHIAGNSLGGRVALEAAADGLVRSATALSPAGFWKGPLDFAYTRALFATTSTVARLAAPIIPTLARSVAGRAALCGWIVAHPSRLSPEQVTADARAMVRALPAMRTIFPQAVGFDRPIPGGIPVTVAWAERDAVLPPYQGRRAAAQLPAASHVVMSGCGHVPMTDDPALVASVLLQGSPAGLLDAPDASPARPWPLTRRAGDASAAS